MGELAKIGQAFRSQAGALPFGRSHHDFWSVFYFGAGPKAYDASRQEGAQAALEQLLQDFSKGPPKQGHVDFFGAAPGYSTLLTHKARMLLREADVVLYDKIVDPHILELAHHEVMIIEVGGNWLLRVYGAK